MILHLDDGIYYSLNPVGTLVWSLLQEPRTQEELVTRVREEFDVGEDRCRSDIEELLGELQARALVQPGQVG